MCADLRPPGNHGTLTAAEQIYVHVQRFLVNSLHSSLQNERREQEAKPAHRDAQKRPRALEPMHACSGIACQHCDTDSLPIGQARACMRFSCAPALLPLCRLSCRSTVPSSAELPPLLAAACASGSKCMNVLRSWPAS